MTIFMTGGGSVFVTCAVTSRCFRLYCSGYFRSSSRLPRLNGRLVGRVLGIFLR